MGTAQTSWQLEWLTVPEGDRLQFPRGWQDLHRTPIPMPKGWGHGTFELFHLGQGMDIARVHVEFKAAAAGHRLPIMAARGSVPDPMFGVYSVRAGSATIAERRIGTEFAVASGSTFFQHVDRLDFEASVDGASDFHGKVITLGVPVLGQLIGQETADQLLAALAIDTAPAGSTAVLPHAVYRLLHETLPDSLSGRMRLLFSQAKTLEYLCAASAHVAAKPAAASSRPSASDAVAALREELVTLQGKVPLLNELAPRYGLSARVLNDQFRKRFGMTIYAFLTDFRLTEAHVALERTDVPMKALAANIGYSHVNHFISAFRKKFGYPPGKVRRGRQTPD